MSSPSRPLQPAGSPTHRVSRPGPHVAAGLATLLACVSPACQSPKVAAQIEDLAVRSERTGVRVAAGDELFALIRAPKGESVAVVELMAHGERPVLRGFPLAARPGETVDHPEHRGLWIGHGSVDGHDLWRDPERIQLVSDSLRMEGSGAVRLELRLRWTDPDGGLLCDESRTMRLESTRSLRTIDTVHQLRATGSGVTFGDVKHGFFALRLADDFRLDRPGTRRLVGAAEVADPAGVDGEGDDAAEGGATSDAWGQPARWIATIAELEDADGTASPVTVAVFDHPANLGHPARWHVRPYGLVAANPFGVNAFAPGGAASLGFFNREAGSGAHRIGPYGTLELRYRVVIVPDELDDAAVEALWQSYAASEE